MRQRIEVARAITPGGVVEPAVVVVGDDGLIAAAATPAQVGETPGAEVVDRRSCTAVPGFVDLQVNGLDGVDVRRAEGSDWDRLGRVLLTSGVTAWCPTVVSSTGDYGAILGRIAEGARRPGRTGLPAILGAHLEGPFLAPEWRGAHPADALRPPDPAWVDDVLDATPVPVAIWTLAPELPGALEVVEILADRGVVASAGHTGATYEQMGAAVAAGASMVTHLFNRQSGLHHREPGVVGAALALDLLSVGVIFDGVHVHEGVAAAAFRALGERGFAVTDAVAGPPVLDDGTLAGGHARMDEIFRRATRLLGIEAAVGVTATTPARAVGATDRGALVEGAVADLVVLDGDLLVDRVWLAGHPTPPPPSPPPSLVRT